MRQQLRSNYIRPASSSSKASTHKRTKAHKRNARARRTDLSGITITPARGFFMALLFLGVPTVSLGGLCFSLLQNNLRLSQTNEELNEMANEVKAEVDSLGEEIDSLRERAGVPESEVPGSAEKQSVKTDEPAETVETAVENGSSGFTTNRASLLVPVRGGGGLARSLPPQGGPANAAEAKELLENVRRQVPQLTRTLDSAIKPALEKTLAEEAALPTGQPVVGEVEVSSEFGIRGNPFGGGSYEMHEGIDFVGAVGDIIAATGDGVVMESGSKGGYGITVVIDHGYGYETLYAHMSETKVKKGDRIKRGQIIGHIGSTGRSSGPHLHYSIYQNKKAIDPRNLLKLPE
ncbi:MAG: M23 family metallopeptidase [Phormidesmis sp.]